jgi:hypothetical protein
MSGSKRACASAALVVAVAALAMWPTAPASAQGPVVQAFVRPEGDVTEDQTLRYTIRIEGGNTAEIPPLSGLTNLRVIAGPERRSSTSWVNGQMSASYEVSWALLPERPGPAMIPAYTLQVGSRTHRTQAIQFRVTEVAKGAPPARTAPPRPGTGAPAPVREGPDVFLRTDVGATEAWVGEPVLLTVSLHTAESVRSPAWVHLPSFPAFWVEDLDVDSDAEMQERMVEGRHYRVYPLLRKILVPQTAGEFEIEPYQLQMEVNERDRRGPFTFPFGSMRRIVRKSQPVTIRARPLPVEGRPDAFSGAVGSYRLDVQIDRTEATVNEAIGMTAVVEGEGFLESASPPQLRAGPDFKVFDPEVQESFEVVRGKMVSRKAWQWVLVPLAPGELRAPEVSFAWFDPKRDTYQSAQSTPPLLAVRRGDSDERVPRAGGEIRVERRDLAYIKTIQGPLGKGFAPAHETVLFRAALVAPIAWVPLVIAVGRRRARLRRDRGRLRASRARSLARKRLDAARRGLGEPGAAFHEEVARALVEYVADRFDRAAAGMTYDTADELLASRGVDRDLRVRFRATLEACDFARFVPTSASTERRAELLEEARAVVDGLERAL